MLRRLAGRTLNEKLAMLAFVLGALAIAAVPYRGGLAVIDTRALALEAAGHADQVAPLDLAAWIIETRSDYRLIDTRSEAEFQRYHIPTAENVPVQNLPDAPLGRLEKIVLCSEGDAQSAGGRVLLRAKGFKGVYILKGGLEAWNSQVLFPVLAENPGPDARARDERLRSMSAFFGGHPRSGATGAMALPAAPSLPKVAGPASPAGGAKAAPKKKEGC